MFHGCFASFGGHSGDPFYHKIIIKSNQKSERFQDPLGDSPDTIFGDFQASDWCRLEVNLCLKTMLESGSVGIAKMFSKPMNVQ